MARRTRVPGFSVPPEVAEEYEELARRERRSKSELFREMIGPYKARREEEEFQKLQARMTRRSTCPQGARAGEGRRGACR